MQDLLVQLERGAPLGRLVLLASQDGLAAWDLLGRWERKASQERRGLWGPLGKMGNRDLSGCQGLRELLGFQETTEIRERQEDPARRAAKETKAKLDPQDLLELKGLWANQACQVQMVSQVHVGSKA